MKYVVSDLLLPKIYKALKPFDSRIKPVSQKWQHFFLKPAGRNQQRL